MLSVWYVNFKYTLGKRKIVLCILMLQRPLAHARPSLTTYYTPCLIVSRLREVQRGSSSRLLDLFRGHKLGWPSFRLRRVRERQVLGRGRQQRLHQVRRRHVVGHERSLVQLVRPGHVFGCWSRSLYRLRRGQVRVGRGSELVHKLRGRPLLGRRRYPVLRLP